MDNTFHFYGICLNRNRKVYSLCNFTRSDSQMGMCSFSGCGRLVKPTSRMILEFPKRQFVPFEFLKSFFPTFEFIYFQGYKYSLLPLLFHFQGNCQWPPPNPSNRTNRRITVYFKGYAYNEYPLNVNIATLKQGIPNQDIYNTVSLYMYY